jgi:electron transfer flavoprotein beta subunit
MNVVVLVKQVPDTWGDRQLRDDGTLDRESVDAVIDEIDTRGVETALQLVETAGGEVTVITMGPDTATDVLRKALAMGAHRALHILDDALPGSCAIQTSAVLAAAVRTVEADVVIAGNESTDGVVGAMGALLAERLGWPQLTSVRALTIQDTTASAERVHETGWTHLSAPLPVVVSVTEKINEPRYPNFKGIMAAKKKPLTTLTVTDLGLDPGTVGLTAATTRVLNATARPPRTGGQKITDDGTAATQVLDYLTTTRLI